MSTVDHAFITFEGIEGAGKSTQIQMLAQWFRARGKETLVTREPGGTPLGEEIRELVLKRAEPLPTNAELLLMFAARAIHIRNLIEPALAQGRSVLCDRFTDASFAYQGFGRGVPLEFLESLERHVQGDCTPNLTLLLDLDVDCSERRLETRRQTPDRFESEHRDFFARVRAGYLQRAAQFPARIAIIDASAPIAAVHASIVAAVNSRLTLTST